MPDSAFALPPPDTDPAALAALLRTFSPAEILAYHKHAAQARMALYVNFLDIGIQPAPHHHLLIEHLEAVERGDIERLMVIFPPGAGKSTYASVLFPAWFMGRHPELNVIAASHTHDLAELFGRRVRNIYGSAEHRAVFGVGLQADSKAADHWITEKGGEYYAVGIGGAVTGRRATGVAIVDDPVKGREDADSDRMRERAWEWYINDFRTRLTKSAKEVMITTRWSEDDLAGRVLLYEPKAWTILHLKMEAGADDPLGRKPGERLWPEWFTPEMVADAKRDTRVWNALYQGEPTGEDGDYFKKAWFNILGPEDHPGTLTYYGASDYAVSEGRGDWTEHGIFGIDHQANYHIVDWWRGQTTPDEWIDAQCSLINQYKPACWFGEKGVIKLAVEASLRNRMEERHAWCRLEWLPSMHEKTARARPFQRIAASGKVYVPYLAGWKADVLGQLLRFPAGMHDDVVDVCSLIGRGLEFIRAPEIAVANSARQSRANVGYSAAKRYMRYGAR
jgi:predicted phage terminase large subunit-like protein